MNPSMIVDLERLTSSMKSYILDRFKVLSARFADLTVVGGVLAKASSAAVALLALLAAMPTEGQGISKPQNGAAWERSIVSLEGARKQYDYYQPWAKRPTRSQKLGLVIGEREILTTADELFDRTLIRLQKGGRGRWFIGEVAWIDYNANLAIVTTTEADFWTGLKPAALGGTASADSTLQILRWRNGNLENRRAEFTQIAVREGQLAAVNQAVIEADSEIQGAGWGEPLIADSHVVGLITSQDGRTCTALPASFIRSILEARKKGTYHGLGYFHFVWQPAANLASLASLKLEGEPRGVIVIDVPDRPDRGEQVIKPKDIILRIDGHDIDIQGDYEDPEFGHLMLENLSTRGKWAGEEFKIQISRDGKPMEVSYRLPKYDFTNSLVPFATYDQEPEYLILGGLVFQPLSDSYLQSWGNEWKRRAPFRLLYARTENPTRERPSLVLLSQVLPDSYNIGYQEQRWLVVDKVNGQSISGLAELRQALQKPVDGFHMIEFVPSDSLRRLVLAAGAPEEEATARVLQRYGIHEAFRFAPEKKP